MPTDTHNLEILHIGNSKPFVYFPRVIQVAEAYPVGSNRHDAGHL